MLGPPALVNFWDGAPREPSTKCAAITGVGRSKTLKAMQERMHSGEPKVTPITNDRLRTSHTGSKSGNGHDHQAI